MPVVKNKYLVLLLVFIAMALIILCYLLFLRPTEYKYLLLRVKQCEDYEINKDKQNAVECYYYTRYKCIYLRAFIKDNISTRIERGTVCGSEKILTNLKLLTPNTAVAYFKVPSGQSKDGMMAEYWIKQNKTWYKDEEKKTRYLKDGRWVDGDEYFSSDQWNAEKRRYLIKSLHNKLLFWDKQCLNLDYSREVKSFLNMCMKCLNHDQGTFIQFTECCR